MQWEFSGSGDGSSLRAALALPTNTVIQLSRENRMRLNLQTVLSDLTCLNFREKKKKAPPHTKESVKDKFGENIYHIPLTWKN
jgi:hypothetical protein